MVRELEREHLDVLLLLVLALQFLVFFLLRTLLLFGQLLSLILPLQLPNHHPKLARFFQVLKANLLLVKTPQGLHVVMSPSLLPVVLNKSFCPSQKPVTGCTIVLRPETSFFISSQDWGGDVLNWSNLMANFLQVALN